MTARPRQTARDKRESTFRYGSAAIISIAKTISNGLPACMCQCACHITKEHKRKGLVERPPFLLRFRDKGFFFFIYFFVVRRILWNAAKGMSAMLFCAFSISYHPAPSVPSKCTVRSTLLLLPFIVLCDNPNFYCFLFFRSPYFFFLVQSIFFCPLPSGLLVSY
jgi:hypothetical protein